MDDYGSGRPSVFKTTKALLVEEGWQGLYRGFGPRFLNMSLFGTSMIVTYELISMFLFLSSLHSIPLPHNRVGPVGFYTYIVKGDSALVCEVIKLTFNK